MHVLIIEDDIPLATQIGDTIEAAGDEPDYADDEALALRLCEMNRYDIVVLDSEMPRCGVDAFCRAAHGCRRTPNSRSCPRRWLAPALRARGMRAARLRVAIG